MLVLLFESHGQIYAIESHYILQVIPSVPLSPLLNVPKYLLGLLDFHGKALPILDFSLLVNNLYSPQMLHTRLILLQLHREVSADVRPKFGIRAEKVTETVECSKEDFAPCGVNLENAAFLGGVWSRPEGMIHLIDVPKLLHLTQRHVRLDQEGEG